MISPQQMKKLYEQGQNICAYLRNATGSQINTSEIIELSYDLQTGSYINSMKKESMARYMEFYSGKIADTILSLCEPQSILEAGVGEATTLSGVLKKTGSNVCAYGFDLSWSRVAYAYQWLQSKGIHGAELCVGNLFSIPFVDNSIDVVFTSHAIEPNGGNEGPILRELYRVTKKYLLLLEPAYELAGDEARKRMELHGYCKNLKQISESLGYEVLEHALLESHSNNLNPTALTIIRKRSDSRPVSSVFACPKYKTPLSKIGDMYYSHEALTVYPIIGGIPCLKIENGILASKYPEVMEYKKSNQGLVRG